MFEPRNKALRREIILGRRPDGDLIVDDSHRHVGLFAATGMGKSQLLKATAFYGWEDSQFWLDRKGVYFRDTSSWRSQVSHIIKYDLDDPRSIRINPFDMVPTDERCVGVLQAILKIFFPERDYFSVAGYQAALAASLHLLHAGEPYEKNLASVRRFLSLGDEGMREIVRVDAHPVATLLASELFNTAGGEEKAAGQRQGVYSTAGVALEIFLNPVIEEITQETEFRFSDLMCAAHPVTFYLMARATHDDSMSPFIRMLVILLKQVLMYDPMVTLDGRHKTNRLLVVLDELTQYEGIRELARAAGDTREYGLRLVVGTQGEGALEESYGVRNMLRRNLATRVYWRPEDDYEADKVSRAIGQMDVEERRETESGRPGPFNMLSNKSVSRSSATVRKDVMPPEELMDMDDDDLIVVIGRTRTQAKRITVWNDPVWGLRHGSVGSLRDVSGKYIDLPSDPPPASPWSKVNAMKPVKLDRAPNLDAPGRRSKAASRHEAAFDEETGEVLEDTVSRRAPL